MAASHRRYLSGIPTAAERYYAQPRVGNRLPSAARTSLDCIDKNPEDQSSWPPEFNMQAVLETATGDRNEKRAAAKKSPIKRRRILASGPTRQSPRLFSRRIAALHNHLRDHLAGLISRDFMANKHPKGCNKNITETLPALSDNPRTYDTCSKDCRLHLPATIEDQLAIRGAMTPTIHGLKMLSPGWSSDVVWNKGSSYVEAHQKCLEDFHGYELTRKHNLVPFDMDGVLILLPWYGRISDFRSSPNWPSGW